MIHPMDEESRIWYKIETVQKMQKYIIAHAADESFDFEQLYVQAGYSRRHADRCFKELLGKTPKEYLKLIRMTSSAKRLMKEHGSILDTALEADFESHEGYTKAFRETFGKLPSEYKRGKSFIPLFVPYPISDYYNHVYGREKDEMEKNCLCMVTPVQRPKRKLIFLRSKDASGACSGYWEFCEMLYFQSQKFENEDDFGTYLKAVFKAAEEYDYAGYGLIVSNIFRKNNFSRLVAGS